MNEIISLKQKRHQKQLKYERKMLKELSLVEIQAKIEDCFGSFINKRKIKDTSTEDGCVDFAIEAFLLGAKYSKFGYYGESMQSANRRCRYEEKQLIDDLYDYFVHWGEFGSQEMLLESIYYACEYYVQSWWKAGFIKGEKRYKLRLH
ncbi:DUF2521 family protein [Metabacillus herbersteinensis]|uniref:DUF2521 family protein n=1 Tax=Metabacillus herbersteinensis TaxID=283816 RepID=A0ABV6GKF4_9BACI